jgi:hypothetical protein
MPKGLQLTPRLKAIIQALGRPERRYKVLDTFQMWRKFFPGTKDYHSATNALAPAVEAGLLSRRYLFPKVSTYDGGRLRSVYYLHPDNLVAIKRLLEAHGRATEWHDFEALETTETNGDLSPLLMPHEVGMADVFLALEGACEMTPGYELLFWDWASPRDGAITQTLVDTHGRVYKFNPDAPFAVKTPWSPCELGFLEYDNDSKDPRAYFATKVRGYQIYFQQGYLPTLLNHYGQKFPHLKPALARVKGFRIFGVAGGERSPQRRNDLFKATLHLKAYKMAWFAAKSDLTAQTILTSHVWLSGKEYAPIATQEAEKRTTMTPAAFKCWQHEQIAQMPRVTFASPPPVKEAEPQPQQQMELFA